MQTLPPKGEGHTALVLVILMMVLCWPTLIARFVVRFKRKALGLDDWLMGSGLLVATAMAGIFISFCLSGGGYNPADPLISSEIMSQAVKFIFIGQILYCLVTIPIKMSICIGLLRISDSDVIYKWSLYAIMSLAAFTGIGGMTGVAASCSPPSAFWRPNDGTCNRSINTAVSYFVSASGILTDFALAILPAFILWNVRLPRPVKVSVAILLGLGATASGATIVRLWYLSALGDRLRILRGAASIIIWTTTEVTIGIFAGSVPALRPLLSYLPWVSTYGGLSTGAAGAAANVPRGENMGHPQQPGAGGHINMSTFRAAAGGRVAEDDDSQEYILPPSPGGDQSAPPEVKKYSSIRKQTEIEIQIERVPNAKNPTKGRFSSFSST